MVTINAAAAGRGAGWLLEGFNYFKNSAGAWIGVTLLLIIIIIAGGLIPFLGSLAVQLLMPVFLAGLILGCRAQDEGGSLGVNHLFAGFGNHTGQLILVGALYLAGVLVVLFLTAILGLLVIGNMEFLNQIAAGNANAMVEHARSILLIVLIALALYLPLIMAVWFAPALVVLHDLGAIEAMICSFQGCLKNIVPFLIYGLVGLVLTIVAGIPMMLGWLILFPMIIASVYIASKEIFQPAAVQPPAS